MNNHLRIINTIKPFNKKLKVEGDKSLSIRWALIASQANGKSKSYNLLNSEDVINTIKCLKKLGTKIKIKKNSCEIIGKGLNNFYYKKNIILDAGNSGTLGRLIMGLLIHSKVKIKLVGDRSLSKRDFLRVINPLKKFGAKISSNKGKLPIMISGTNHSKPIHYNENKGSAQCKSSILLAALNTKGVTTIKAKKSRDHTELLLNNLGLPITVKRKKNHDFIKLIGKKNIRPFNYNIPSDISSCAFFIVLTTLSKNSRLKITNINVNPTRIGVLKILKKWVQILNCKILKITKEKK